MSIATTFGPLNNCKRGINEFIAFLLWSSWTPLALSTDPRLRTNVLEYLLKCLFILVTFRIFIYVNQMTTPISNGTQLMPSVGFPLKNWKLWHVCLQNKKNCCHIKYDSLQWAEGLQFANYCMHVPVHRSSAAVSNRISLLATFVASGMSK